MYINKLDEIADKYNITYRKIKIKPADIRVDVYIDFNDGKNDKDSKFKVSDHVRISKYKNIFAKVCTLNWSEETFVVRNVQKITEDLKSEDVVETFYEK